MDDIEIRVHTEFTDYREKFYGFTLRQIVFFILMAIIVVSTYIGMKDTLGDDLASWLVCIVALPIAFIGFIPVQGLDAERILPFWYRNYMKFVKPLEYMTEKQILAKKNEMSKKYRYFEDGSVQKLSKKERKEKKKYLKIKKKQEKQLKKQGKVNKRKIDTSSKQETKRNKRTEQKELKLKKRMEQKELKKKQKQDKMLKKAKKKFGIKNETIKTNQSLNDDVLPPFERKDIDADKFIIGTTNSGEEQVEQVPLKQMEEKEMQKDESVKIQEAVKKFEMYQTFKKLKPEATQEEFEEFYIYMMKSGEKE